MTTPRIFRKKPVEIEAVQVSELLACIRSDREALPRWIVEACDNGNIVTGHDFVTIATLEGTMIGGLTDWIIRGIDGELYPCKDEIFTRTYDQVG